MLSEKEPLPLLACQEHLQLQQELQQKQRQLQQQQQLLQQQFEQHARFLFAVVFFFELFQRCLNGWVSPVSVYATILQRPRLERILVGILYVLGVNCYCTDIRKTPVGVNVGQAQVSPWFGSKVISKLWMLERGDLTMGIYLGLGNIPGPILGICLGVGNIGLGRNHVPPVKQ